MILRVWLSLLLLSVSLNGWTPPAKLDGAEARAAIASFIQAFDNLDWDKFRLAFADDATVFYPRKYAQRASGRAEFEATFHQVFEQIRDGKTAPPFMDIQPRNMEIQNLGDTVIATLSPGRSRGLSKSANHRAAQVFARLEDCASACLRGCAARCRCSFENATIEKTRRACACGSFRLAVGIGLRLSTLRGPSGKLSRYESCEDLERKP